MRILTLSSLYPNAEQPNHGLFVEQRLRHLLSSAPVEARVVAPVPWFPLRSRLFGEYGRFARVPVREQRHGIDIDHPRYPVVPKIGMNVAPVLMARALRPFLARLRRHSDFDLIDAHYYYPDGVAAVQLGRWLGKPVIVTGRGSDLNLIATYPSPRRQIRWAARFAAANVTVSAALRRVLMEIGVSPERIAVLRNGVDLDRFRPDGRAGARQELGLSGPALISVGALIESKGHHIAIEALSKLSGVELIIVGDGPMRSRLRDCARSCGVDHRVRFLGQVPHDGMAGLYAAADALVLASSREGMPNVVLEAIACGTPIVASDVGGLREIVSTPVAGILCRRSPDDLAQALQRLLAAPPDRAATRRHAEQFGWEETSQGLWQLFQQVLERRTAAA